MKRFNVINYFITKYGFKSYLEIGIDNPNNCFNKISCEYKVGVDPNKNTTHRITSDAFFKMNTEKFDIVFIDGLHRDYQFIKDVENSLKIIPDNGIIVCHDCRPYNKKVARPERVPGQSWYGDVYLGWLTLRHLRDDIQMGVVPFDCGVGIIKKGSQICYPKLITTFEEYFSTQTKSLPIISIEDMKKYF